MRRRTVAFIVTLTLSIFVTPLVSDAQQPAQQVSRIGVRSGALASAIDSRHEAFLQGVRELGAVEGKNRLRESRYAEEQIERYPDLAVDLVRRHVDSIVITGIHATAAAQHATSTIPLVVRSAGDLGGDGLVASLAKPGGISPAPPTWLPTSAENGWRSSGKPYRSPPAWLSCCLHIPETAAVSLGVHVHSVEVRDPQALPGAYAAMTQHHAQAVILLLSTSTKVHRRQLLDLATPHRVPSLCEPVAWTRDGGLLSEGPDLAALWRRAATAVDTMLHGAPPADLAVEPPTTCVLAINLTTAKALGLTIPPALLL